MTKLYLAQLILSIVILLGGGAVAISKDQAAETRGTALAAVGLVVGYWFKSPLQE